MLQPKPDTYFENLLDGEAIAEGTTRRVYAVKGRGDVVIKKTKTPWPGTNIIEWTVWNALQQMGEDILGNNPNLDLKNLFATCLEISETGRFLMMERLTALDQSDRVEMAKFPDWLNDKKPNAFGKVGDKIKVMDYAGVDFYAVLNPKNRSFF